VAATAAIAVEAELVSGPLEAAAGALHLSTVFVGVIVLALVGTASDLFAASYFAYQGKMGSVMTISVGSSIQVALVVFLGTPMRLDFGNPLDLFAGPAAGQ